MKTKYSKLYEIQQIYGFHAIKPLSLILGFLCAMILVLKEWGSQHFAIVMLPVVFFFVSLLFNYNKNVKGLGSFIIVIAYMLRFTIFPVIISLGNYRADVSETVYLPYFTQSCLMMTIELLAVFALLAFFGNRSYRRHKSEKDSAASQTQSKSFSFKSIKIMIAVLLIYVLAVCCIYPQLFTTYWRIIFFMGDSVARLNRLKALIDVIPGMIYYPFKYCAELLHYLIPIALVVRVNHSKCSLGIKWLVALLIGVVAFSVLTSEQINSVIVLLCVVLYMLISHKESGKIIVPLGICGFAVVCVFVFRQIADASDMGSLGRIVNNYFDGPIGGAIALHMRVNSSPTAADFFADILKNIPVLEALAPHADLNTLYGAAYGMPGAIIPMSGYGYYYFGYLGCWLPAALVVVLVDWFDELYRKSKNDVSKIVMSICTVHMSISVFMYTICIVYANALTFFLPMLIVRFFAEGDVRVRHSQRVCRAVS